VNLDWAWIQRELPMIGSLLVEHIVLAVLPVLMALIVSLPLGFLVSKMRRATNIVLAFLGTIAAGLTGVMDNIKNYDGAAPNAGTKIILATTLFLLTAGISLVRFRNPNLFQQGNRFLYIASYGLSFAIALVLAFLGGVILYGF